MSDQNANRIPESPETQAADVREDLHQNMVTHEGAKEENTMSPNKSLGAVEDEVAPVKPPMHGPGNLVGKSASGDSSDEEEDEDLIDPVDELTPG